MVSRLVTPTKEPRENSVPDPFPSFPRKREPRDFRHRPRVRSPDGWLAGAFRSRERRFQIARKSKLIGEVAAYF